MHMNRPGTIIKASTIHDLKPIPEKEPIRDCSFRLPVSVSDKLRNASKEKGYPQNEIVVRALKEFLK